MHPIDIQAELKRHKTTQKSIAQELQVSEFHVSAVIRKLRESDRVQKAVAKKIHRDHREVFPEYYFNLKRAA